jgi:hypothetical protein
MPPTRFVALQVNGLGVTRVKVRHLAKGPELVVTDPLLEEFAVDDSFTLELLELVHPRKIRNRLPNSGWRRVSLRILIALLRGGTVRVVAGG